MRRCFCWLIPTLLPLSLMAAVRTFDFSNLPENEPPPGFRSAVTGFGKPGDWKIVLDDMPAGLPTLTPGARGVTRRAVLAQLAQDTTDEHFPLLMFDQESYGDFTFSTRFKTVRGAVEQMAGIAFRIQNETNYYVVRASSLGNTFRFYEVVNGIRGAILGPEVPIPSGVWHELKVQCKGSQITCSLDDKDLITVDDSKNYRFKTGKIGFWTKSDSVTYFTDAKIVYTPREMPAQVLVREALKQYPRLLDLRIYIPASEPNPPRIVACRQEADIGEAGGEAEKAVIAQSGTYYGKDKAKGVVSVMMPLRDRNGESIAAARVMMKPLPGQTEASAIARARPIIQGVQQRVQTLQDLVD
jgi:hypothetical protein